MRGLLVTTGVIVALIAATFLPQVQDFRDSKAYEYVEQGKLKQARRLYRIGKLQGSEAASNNFHVLNYRMIRYDENASKKQRMANKKKAFRAFDKLTQKGFVPAAYNAGMFHYGAKVGSERYETGLKYFDFAAASGDSMSGHAADMMRARKHKKLKKYQAFRDSADKGNGWAAYRYANNLRFDKNTVRSAEKYALMGAEAGYADAQQFLSSYYPHRKDKAEWLEKAATHKYNRSLMAARDLADMAKSARDYEARRQWLTVASSPRDKFRYAPIMSPEGLRWRDLQNTILADANTSQSSAYALALMQMDGIGGPVDKAGAIKSLEYADYWADAALLLGELKSGAPETAGKTSTKTAKSPIDENLKKFDSHKNMPYYETLRPYVKNKHIRYATRTDLKKYANGVSKMFSNKKNGYRDWGDVEDCSIAFDCFYLEKPIILPDGMFGSRSATFVINPAINLPEQYQSHNKYIFLNERYVP